MKRRTLTDLFDIELPIIQAPMAGVQDHRLAVAVSNAGGLGSLPAAMFDAARLGKELAALKAATSRPFNVNFFCHTAPPFDEAREARWRKALAPYYAEFGIDPRDIPSSPARRPFDQATADVVAEHAPPVVSFHFGLPSDALMKQVRSWGSKILSSATTVDEARWLEARGVDAIIAQGLEAGGHRGHFLSSDLSLQANTLDLVRRIVSAVAVPVIAAGGIAAPSDVVAARSAGAAAVQPGSAYLLCPEATTSAMHRAALKGSNVRDTALTNLFSGGVARGIMNRLMRELGPMSDLPPDFPLAGSAVAPLRAAAERIGRGDFSPLWVGTKGAGLREVPAAGITRELGQA
jgi:nitronate monooxygenase